MSFRLRAEPRCPGCAELLQPVVVEIRAGWAWCPICAAHRLFDDPNIAFAIHHPAIASHSTIQHGVLFFTPGSHVPLKFNALDVYEQLLSEDRFALTAKDEAALVD